MDIDAALLYKQGMATGPYNQGGGFIKLCSAGDNAEAAIVRAYLEDSGIEVYVQGENHRSMLGMVGAYIDLNILVPESDFAEASRLMTEFHSAEVHEDIVKTEGPNRDDFSSDENPEIFLELESTTKRRIKAARMFGLLVPFGGAHFAAGAPVRGLVLAAMSVFAIVSTVTQSVPLLLLAVPAAMAMDYFTVPKVLMQKLARDKERVRAELMAGPSTHIE